MGFDGIDWDIEGKDDQTDPSNHFTLALLDLMGHLSQSAKQAGLLVSIVPPESYLDPTTSLFDLSLLHPYPEWEAMKITFSYHAHNTYGYLLVVYGQTKSVDTFDLVMPQIYETYSHADYQISVAGVPAATYLENYVKNFTQTGWTIDFSTSPEPAIKKLGKQKVIIKKEKLIIGLANGWANSKKSIFIDPVDVGSAYSALKTADNAPRGFMFWCIAAEGTMRQGKPVFMAKGLNDFLHIRS